VDNARRVRLPTTIPGDPGQQPFEPNERTKSHPAWHPDGERFAGVVQNGNTIERIYVMRMDLNATGTEVPVTEAVLLNDGAFTSLDPQWFYDAPAFSPDGQWLAYSRFFYKPGNENAGIPAVSRPMAVYAYNAATGDSVKVTPGATRENHPTWSPDGTKIAFTSNRSGSDEVWVIDFDPSASEPVISSLRRLTRSNASDVGGTPTIQAQSFDPAWTSSGTIVFTSTRRAPCSSQRGRNLWQMAADGSDVKVLYFSREDDHYPAIDPSNGRTVVFSTMFNPVEAFNGQKTDLYVLRNF
jgi:Tol biopolymer transport system component